jgi:hypothetical protein
MCKTPVPRFEVNAYFCLYISSMNTIPSHEALLKATDLIKKISEGLSSAHFSLNLIEKDLLRKQCLELYEQLLMLDVQQESLLEQAVQKEKEPEPVLPIAEVHVEEPEEKVISSPQVVPDVTPSSLSFDFTEEVEEVKEMSWLKHQQIIRKKQSKRLFSQKLLLKQKHQSPFRSLIL